MVGPEPLKNQPDMTPYYSGTLPHTFCSVADNKSSLYSVSLSSNVYYCPRQSYLEWGKVMMVTNRWAALPYTAREAPVGHRIVRQRDWVLTKAQEGMMLHKEKW